LENVWLAIIGLAAGLLGGLLGIGGSIVMIPAMTELLGPQQHLYQAAAMIVNFFVAAPAVVQHVRARAVNVAVVRGLVPAAMTATVAGVACSELAVFRGVGSLYLTGLFGCFLFLVAGRDVSALMTLENRRRASNSEKPLPYGRGSDDRNGSRELRSWRVAILVGLPTGFVAGLLGVGGGVLAVPLQRRFCGIGIRSAIANSAAMIVALSVVGAGVKNVALAWNHSDVSWTQPFSLALLLIPTAIVGSLAGGRLTHVLPVRTVRVAFDLLLFVAAIRMILRAIGG